MRGHAHRVRLFATIALVAAVALASAWTAHAGRLRRSGLFVKAAGPQYCPATTTTKLGERPFAEYPLRLPHTPAPTQAVEDPGAPGSPSLDHAQGLTPMKELPELPEGNYFRCVGDTTQVLRNPGRAADLPLRYLDGADRYAVSHSSHFSLVPRP